MPTAQQRAAHAPMDYHNGNVMVNLVIGRKLRPIGKIERYRNTVWFYCAVVDRVTIEPRGKRYFYHDGEKWHWQKHPPEVAL